MAILAAAMVLKGWQTAGVGLGLAVVCLGAVPAIQVRRAVRRLRDHSAAVQTAAAQSERHYAGVLARIVEFVESRDRHIHGHSQRVGVLAERLALRLGMPADRAARLNLAGQLHDVGLLAVPAETLARHARLSHQDLRSVQQHARIASEMLCPLGSLGDIVPAVRHHHERMNGTGYPDGLCGEAIPLEARILAVADSYDAMTHDRPHRTALAPAEALRELRRCSPAGYDSLCVQALSQIVSAPDGR